MSSKEGVILVGHGGVPKDFPKAELTELKRLEGQRQAKKEMVMSPREEALDTKIREWPRTMHTEPYKFGVEALAEKLRPLLQDQTLMIAYNEFCGPSLDAAIEHMVSEKFTSIKVITTMLTPGGYHSEIEIPDIVNHMKKKHPSVDIQYMWPFNLNRVAELLASQTSNVSGSDIH